MLSNKDGLETRPEEQPRVGPVAATTGGLRSPGNILKVGYPFDSGNHNGPWSGNDWAGLAG